MYLQMMVADVKPTRVREVYQVLTEHKHRVECPGIQGLNHSYLSESLEEPSRILWLSTWETKAQANAFLNSPKYNNLVATILQYLLDELRWYGYWVLEEL